MRRKNERKPGRLQRLVRLKFLWDFNKRNVDENSFHYGFYCGTSIVCGVHFAWNIKTAGLFSAILVILMLIGAKYFHAMHRTEESND